jgi:hypothetical protein
MKIVPSMAAGNYIVRSGAVTINGLVSGSLSQMRPGDIMQLNITI